MEENKYYVYAHEDVQNVNGQRMSETVYYVSTTDVDTTRTMSWLEAEFDSFEEAEEYIKDMQRL